MEDANAVGQLAAHAFSIVKDVTVTGLLLWFVRMLLTGDVVRKGELTDSKDREVKAEASAKYWEGKFHEERQTVKDHVEKLRDTVETAMRIREEHREEQHRRGRSSS